VPVEKILTGSTIARKYVSREQVLVVRAMQINRIARFVANTLVLTFLFFTSSAHASDVSKFEIYGVRLYMSGEQVVRTIKAKFGEKVPFRITRQRGVFIKGQVFSTLSLHHGDYDLEVTFHDALPDADTQPEQVSNVTLKSKSYVFEGAKSTEQWGKVEQEFIDDVLAQYDEPDNFVVCNQIGCPVLKQGRPEWCRMPKKYDGCIFQPTMRESFTRDGGVVFELVLENPNAQRDIEYYQQTHVPDQHLSSSPFK
jgi:hypothetical protein